MHQTEIIQFNVYTDIIPNGRQIFYLESFNGKKWESVFDNKNRLDNRRCNLRFCNETLGYKHYCIYCH